jgi:hypothetical protein
MLGLEQSHHFHQKVYLLDRDQASEKAEMNSSSGLERPNSGILSCIPNGDIINAVRDHDCVTATAGQLVRQVVGYRHQAIMCPGEYQSLQVIEEALSCVTLRSRELVPPVHRPGEGGTAGPGSQRAEHVLLAPVGVYNRWAPVTTKRPDGSRQRGKGLPRLVEHRDRHGCGGETIGQLPWVEHDGPDIHVVQLPGRPQELPDLYLGPGPEVARDDVQDAQSTVCSSLVLLFVHDLEKISWRLMIMGFSYNLCNLVAELGCESRLLLAGEFWDAVGRAGE